MLFGTAEPMEHHRHDIHSVVFVFLTYAKERVNLLSRNINRILEGAPAAKHLDIILHIILDGSGNIDTRFLRQLHMEGVGSGLPRELQMLGRPASQHNQEQQKMMRRQAG